MGTIVINQTDCKQNVVLQSTVDGITGGYYDAAGVWHEIGGGGGISFYNVTLTLSNDSTEELGLGVIVLEDVGDFIAAHNETLNTPGASINSLAFDNYLLASTGSGGIVFELISGNAEIKEEPDMEAYLLIVKGSGEIVVRLAVE